MKLNDDVLGYLNTLDLKRKQDMVVLMELTHQITGYDPTLVGTILYFGHLTYKYKTGRSGVMPLVGISSRKQAITIYMSYDINQYEDLSLLGKYQTGKGCLYIKKTEDVSLDVLEELMKKAIKDTLALDFITVNEVNV
jgi:hypothetical protein